MQETVIATGTDVKFIGGVTPMTQENWQAYFSTFHKNGIIGTNDFKQGSASSSYFVVYDGSVFANGIIAKLETANGYTLVTTPTSSERDILICARVYLKQEKIELVRKTTLAAGSSYQNCADVIVNLIQNEDAYCTRNDDYYDIAIAYVNYLDTYSVIDCRRFSGKIMWRDVPEKYRLRGDGSYTYNDSSGAYFEIDPFVPPTEAQLVYIAKTSGQKDNSFGLRYYLSTNSTFTTNISPLIMNSLPLTYYYDPSVFAINSTSLVHVSLGMAAGEPVVFSIYREADTTDFNFAITVEGK